MLVLRKMGAIGRNRAEDGSKTKEGAIGRERSEDGWTREHATRSRAELHLSGAASGSDHRNWWYRLRFAAICASSHGSCTGHESRHRPDRPLALLLCGSKNGGRSPRRRLELERHRNTLCGLAAGTRNPLAPFSFRSSPRSTTRPRPDDRRRARHRTREGTRNGPRASVEDVRGHGRA
jgi:hypothetical protein